jgi:transposase
MTQNLGKQRKRRTFTDEYRAEVVQLVHASDKPLAQIARDLDLSISAVRSWVGKSKAKTRPQAKINEVDYEAENKALRKQIKVLEMEREILKKATAFVCHERDQ